MLFLANIKEALFGGQSVCSQGKSVRANMGEQQGLKVEEESTEAPQLLKPTHSSPHPADAEARPLWN